MERREWRLLKLAVCEKADLLHIDEAARGAYQLLQLPERMRQDDDQIVRLSKKETRISFGLCS